MLSYKNLSKTPDLYLKSTSGRSYPVNKAVLSIHESLETLISCNEAEFGSDYDPKLHPISVPLNDEDLNNAIAILYGEEPDEESSAETLKFIHRHTEIDISTFCSEYINFQKYISINLWSGQDFEDYRDILYILCADKAKDEFIPYPTKYLLSLDMSKDGESLRKTLLEVPENIIQEIFTRYSLNKLSLMYPEDFKFFKIEKNGMGFCDISCYVIKYGRDTMEKIFSRELVDMSMARLGKALVYPKMYICHEPQNSLTGLKKLNDDFRPIEDNDRFIVFDREGNSIIVKGTRISEYAGLRNTLGELIYPVFKLILREIDMSV
jgi:hypothetical protein